VSDLGRLQALIESAYEERAALSPENASCELRGAVETSIEELDAGRQRVAEKRDGAWHVNQWLKKAVLLSFRIAPNAPASAGPIQFYDKVPLKYSAWNESHFAAAGVRVVPPATVRRGAFVARNAVLMPSYVNIGAYVDSGTMVDTWATVGSCAQIGKNVHLSGGVGIGGVLEPLQASPTIVEDNCFIGARSEVVEGVIVGTGAVLSMGVFISATTKVVDRATGQIHVGKVPPYSVVVPGNIGGGPDRPSTYCAVIVKTVDERTRSKTSINELLRD
jgi:2,3,4,5-tetrahydropyridine-2,6-dicarboxylate N-succinyltransferase